MFTLIKNNFLLNKFAHIFLESTVNLFCLNNKYKKWNVKGKDLISFALIENSNIRFLNFFNFFEKLNSVHINVTY